jgi:hypothetical protein
MSPLKTVQVPKATGGSTTQTNATNFESGDSTLTNIAVSVSQFSNSFHLTNAQINSGHKMSSLFEINLRQLANKVLDTAFAPVTNANFGADVVDVASGSFDTDSLKSLWAGIKDADVKNLILDGSYYAQILPTNQDAFDLSSGSYGFDGIYLNNRWSGAGSNIVGMACDPSALAVASGIPVTSDAVSSLLIEQEIIEIPDLGISIQFNMWASTASRETWASFDVMFGAAAGDTTAVAILGNGS